MMLSLLTALLVSLATQASAKQQQAFYRGSDARSARYLKHAYTALDVKPVHHAGVADVTECVFSCLQHRPCLSFNVAIKLFQDKYECQLLAADKYDKSERLKSSKDFHHYSIRSPCESSPCQNGGSCLPVYEIYEYKCRCSEVFFGVHCEKGPCLPVGVQNASRIPNENMEATSRYDTEYAAQSGRLHGPEAWCPDSRKDPSDYLQIDLGTEHDVCAVATQGRPEEWTTQYKLELSRDGTHWAFYKKNNEDKIFPGNSDKSTVVKNFLESHVRARYVRFYPQAYDGWPCLRVEVYALE